MFNGIKNFFRQAVYKMNMFLNGSNSSNNFLADADVMQDNIQRWYDLYQGNAPWLEHNKQSLGLPAAIASEIARLVTLEMQINIKAPIENNSNSGLNETRAEYIDNQLKTFKAGIRKHCEYACAAGGIMFKPYYNGKEIAIDCVLATDFKPLAFDNKGKITSCLFAEHKVSGKYVYHRIEKHELHDRTLTITNKCYKALNKNDKGNEIPLSEVPDWSNISPETKIENISSSLYAYFGIPLGNIIDLSSPLGVSVYARAVDLIEDADKQYQRLMWEFEGGELAIDAPEDVFPTDINGTPIVPQGKERLYRKYDLDTDKNHADIIKTFSPTLRDASLKNGLNIILQKIEFNVGLAYGTLSDPLVVDKTAEEIKTSKQRSYSTITDIQKALQTAIEDLIYAVDTTAKLYKLGPEGEYETSFVWDDSIVIDANTERSRDMNEVRMGLMQKWEYRVKWYGEDEETAKAAVFTEKDNNDLFNGT